MASEKIHNVNIISQKLLPTPAQITASLPRSDKASQTVVKGRQGIENILRGVDPRLFLVVGPCSIHDVDAALEYAERLQALSEQVEESLMLVMRVYFEKPRTTVGWKGLINDPRLDDSFCIDEGLYKARKLLLDLAELGIPTGTETLEPLTPQYLVDLISWSAIGARTAESQTHREISSGLSTPVGIKNSTTGSIEIALNALHSVGQPHHFLGINEEGQCTVFQTKGNSNAHLILRGGSRPNYDPDSIAFTEGLLKGADLPVNIVVDCSHGNSLKDPSLQPVVFENCVQQVVSGCTSIVGMMLESNLNWGSQIIPEDLSQLEHGVSVTDACIDWETTERIVKHAAEQLKPVIEKRSAA